MADDEAWELAIAAALRGQPSPPRALTLDGAVKCLRGRLPSPAVFERFPAVEDLSVAGVRLASLAGFPRLPALRRLVLSDNRIAGSLDALAAAGLAQLQHLDLSNNRIQSLDDLAPLAQLKLVSLDLYECPVTRVKDYREKVFGLMPSLQYLDKMDREGNERLESDDEEEDEEEEYEDGEEEEEMGSGEIEGEKTNGLGNGSSRNLSNGWRAAAVAGEGEEDGDEEDEEDLGEEIDEEEGEEEGVEQGEEGEEEIDEEDADGEIDGHEQGEDENGEIGEEVKQGVEEHGEDDEDESWGTEYVVQPISKSKDKTRKEETEEVDSQEGNVSNSAEARQSSSSLHSKRKRDGGDDLNGEF